MDLETLQKLKQSAQEKAREVLADPVARQRYDINQDGVIDGVERVQLEAEILASLISELTRPATEEPHLPEYQKYQILRPLGQGAHGVTYVAEDADGKEVVLKKLAMHRLEDWKALQLFEREAEVLKKLNHKFIPKLVDAFHEENERGRELFVVQSFVDGKDLERHFSGGKKWTEDEARDFLLKVCPTLDYLHKHRPPIVHRDIKPSNIIRTKSGDYFLVDFGTVTHAAFETSGGSTVAGTAGFMPIEQLVGQSVPATDLYAAGATVVQMMTGKRPSELPIVRSKLQFVDHLSASVPFINILQKLVEPNLEDRFATASEVIEALNEKADLNTGLVPVDKSRYALPADGFLDVDLKPNPDPNAQKRYISARENLIALRTEPRPKFFLINHDRSYRVSWRDRWSRSLTAEEERMGVTVAITPSNFRSLLTMIVGAAGGFLFFFLELPIQGGVLLAVAFIFAFVASTFRELVEMTVSRESQQIILKYSGNRKTDHIPFHDVRFFVAGFGIFSVPIYLVTRYRVRRVGRGRRSFVKALVSLLNVALLADPHQKRLTDE